MASVMTVRVTDELKDDLKNSASKQGLTRNSLIIQILWKYIYEQKNQ